MSATARVSHFRANVWLTRENEVPSEEPMVGTAILRDGGKELSLEFSDEDRYVVVVKRIGDNRFRGEITWDSRKREEGGVAEGVLSRRSQATRAEADEPEDLLFLGEWRQWYHEGRQMVHWDAEIKVELDPEPDEAR
jgi:hypothetical protein